MPTFVKKEPIKREIEAQPANHAPDAERLAKLIKELKNEAGSYHILARNLGIAAMTANKWAENRIDNVLGIKTANLRSIANLKGWTIDQLVAYLETGTLPIDTPIALTVPQSQASPQKIDISALSFEEKMALNLELAKSLAQEKPPLPLSLSEKERLKLGRLLDASLIKTGKLATAISEETELAIALIESIANADEGLKLDISDLDKIAPYCLEPTRWDGTRPLPGDTFFQNGGQLLDAIKNGNGAETK